MRSSLHQETLALIKPPQQADQAEKAERHQQTESQDQSTIELVDHESAETPRVARVTVQVADPPIGSPPTIADPVANTSEPLLVEQSPLMAEQQFSPAAFPIDLATALQLAGADNWNVRLAREQVQEAQADYLAARAMWLPSLSAGLGYNHHDGRIQQTTGEVIDVSRNSLFAGAGASITGHSISGGAGGPMRLVVDLSLADALFEPLYRCQLVHAARSSANAAFNDAQFQAGAAYYQLVRANSTLALAQINLNEATEVLNTTTNFVEAGKGSPADVSRMRVIERSRQQLVTQAGADMAIASTQLARVLQMDLTQLAPQAQLMPSPGSDIPVALMENVGDLNGLVALAINSRPEVQQLCAQTRAAASRTSAEQWRPLVPSVHLGASGGGFGGGQGSSFPDFNGRADMDLAVVWQVENLGLGTRAVRKRTQSLQRQANLQLGDARDQVAAEVAQAWYQVNATLQQIDVAEESVTSAADAMSKTMERIRGLEGDPLELIVSLTAMSQSRTEYLDRVIDYNIAQLRLLRAIGTSGAGLQ
ncbi:MAG: TolC family protein [Pirellulaceae bacterium]